MPTDLKEFDDLIAALQDERPQIDPGFASELDQRAAAGFPKPGRRFRIPFPKISMMVGAPAAAFSVLIAVVVAAALLGGGATEDDMGGAGSTAASGGSAAAVDQAEESDAPTAASGGEEYLRSARRESRSILPAADSSLESLNSTSKAAPGSAAVGQGRRGRLQELSADLTLVAPAGEIAAVGDRILATTDEIGGFVVSSNVRATDGDGGGGSFQLRVPTDRLEDAIARLSRIAHVRERSQGVLDITSERNVARERLEESRAERVSLLQRLEEADTDYEVDALQQQIAVLNDAIGRYRADLRRVVRRAQFAAVHVELMAAGDDEVLMPDDGKWTPGDALRDAGRVLEVIAGVALVTLAVLIPLLLLAGAALVMRRVAGRRGRQRVLDAV